MILQSAYLLRLFRLGFHAREGLVQLTPCSDCRLLGPETVDVSCSPDTRMGNETVPDCLGLIG